MTAVEPGQSTAAPATSDRDDVAPGPRPPVIGLCPYLAADGGAWRSATPAREHRCGAVSPPAPLATEKQRRLCLTAEHATCATYEAAQATRWVIPERGSGRPRVVARSTPVVLDRGRFNIAMPALRTDRTTGQAILVILLGIAFVAIVLAKLSSGGEAGIAGAPGASSSPRASAAGASPSRNSASAAPASSAGSGASADASASAAPSGGPTARPTPRPTTYTVKTGNTLASIAKKFGTTAAILAKLNGIKDPSKLRVGQVLKIPPAG